MLYYNKFYISEGVDLAKSNKSKECMICYYWYINHGFKFEDYVYNGCYDLTILYLNISDITINNVKNADYRCIFHNITNSEATNLLESVVLKNRRYIYKILS